MLSYNAAGMYAVGIILPVLSTLALIARFYVRRTIKAKYGADDWTALSGLIGLWSITGVLLAGTAKGLFGTHTIQDPITHGMVITDEHKNVKYLWVVLSLTIAAITLIKLSVVFLYRRLFHVSRAFNIYSAALCVVLTAWAVAFICANFLQCGTRPWAFWTTISTIHKYCDDTGAATVAFAASDMVLDLVVLLSPVRIIWTLQISTTQKFQVLGVFALGFLSTAASVARFYIMYMDLYHELSGYRDVKGRNSMLVTWSIVEVTAALVGSCLPTMRPLFSGSTRSFGSLISSVRSMTSLKARVGGSLHTHAPEEGLALASIGGREYVKLEKGEV